jgi:signal transduction histidine kinase
MMSHELRTPLNAIGGYVELMRLGIAGTLTPQQTDFLERVRKSQSHLLAIINDLLNYSRIEAGHVSYDIGPVPVGEILTSVLAMIEPQTAAKGLALVPAEPPADCLVQADRVKTEQILMNLLTNAVKFTPAGGTLRLDCRVLEERVEVLVHDTGVGVPRDKQTEIFEPFVQLGRTALLPGEGAGLGLAISRDLARAMGGDVTVESEPGHGSTFVLSLKRGVAGA